MKGLRKIKVSNTQQRLKYLMNERGLQQKDILKLTEHLCKQYEVKFNKSDISQYVAGKTEPNQDKLFILSESLHVNVAWLMGFDVPMENNYNTMNTPQLSHSIMERLSIALNELNPEGQERVIEYAEDLVAGERYKKRNPHELGKKQA